MGILTTFAIIWVIAAIFVALMIALMARTMISSMEMMESEIENTKRV